MCIHDLKQKKNKLLYYNEFKIYNLVININSDSTASQKKANWIKCNVGWYIQVIKRMWGNFKGRRERKICEEKSAHIKSTGTAG